MRSGIIVLLLTACAPTPPEPAYPAERFTKRDQLGKPVELSSGPWQCVHDQETDLLWEVKSANENRQYVLSTYSWFDGVNGVADNGSCAEDDHAQLFPTYYGCDSLDLIHHLNQTRYCGASNWRLPTEAELLGLSIRPQPPGLSRLPAPLFPRVAYGLYWTADTRHTENSVQHLATHLYSDEHSWLSSEQVAFVMAVSQTP